MDLFITHSTALHYLRTQSEGVRRRTAPFAGAEPESAETADRADRVSRASRAARADRRLKLYDFSEVPDETPLHLAVASKPQRLRRAGIECHLLEANRLPPQSFVPVSPGVYSASPELCFINLAGELPFLALIELGFELCGSYSIDRSTDRGFADRQPLTSAARLAEYARDASGLHGSATARRAARYVIDGAASPKESQLAMLLTLPTRLGGYGFEKPQLNGAVDVPPSLQREFKAKHLYCDLYWPDHDVAVEYDSDQYHTGPERNTHDSERQTKLKRLGVEPISVTKDQLYDANRFETVVKLVAQYTGRRLRIRSSTFPQRRWELRRALFGRDRVEP